MINVQASQLATSEHVAPLIKRIGPRAFLFVCALEGIFLTAIVLFASSVLLPQWPPLVRSADYSLVREAVWSRVNGTAADPLIEIANGLSARASSVRGFTLNGQTYYYYLQGRSGLDPLSRGAVDQGAVDVVLYDREGPQPLVVYQIRKP